PRLSAQCGETRFAISCASRPAWPVLNTAQFPRNALRKAFDLHSGSHVCYRIEGINATDQLYDTKPKI
ncbi:MULTISPECIES: hypothetical protein, partial [unclassified Paraburkholderia]|uniref:hypothetical protein n=1 Tax=unclassified Paraburkholderia TaxID=2615204 RepID=UPI002AB7A4AC